MMNAEPIRVFVSSPGDAMVERQRVERVIDRLNGRLAGRARLQAIRWENRYYSAHDTFQRQIPEAAECDLVIGVLRHRLGTPLPDDFPTRPDGTPYPSGTAYEILTALEARKTRTLPDIYVFRYARSPQVDIEAGPERRETEDQWMRLKAFVESWFLSAEGRFKGAFHTYLSEDDLETQVEALLQTWVEERLAGGKLVDWPVAVKGSPFRGLEAFGAKHAPVFFGRDRETVCAADALRDAAARAMPFLLAIGPSGSGKSSLVRAGVVPHLTTPGAVAGVDAWRVATLRPSSHPDGPLMALAAALFEDARSLVDEEQGRPPALPELAGGPFATPSDLAKLLAHGDESATKPIVSILARIAADMRANEAYGRPVAARLLLVVDQLEELFTADVSPAERHAFVATLGSLAATGAVWTIATLRADFYEAALAEPGLAALKSAGASVDVQPPGAAGLADIVRLPAMAADLAYENDAAGRRLDDRLLTDADQSDMLPLLQFTLNRLFENRTEAGGDVRLTHAAYDAMGGLDGAIDKEAERALTGLGETERATLPRLLRALVTHAGTSERGGRMTARSARLASLAAEPRVKALADALIEARILLTDGSGDGATVRLAHERVLESWTRARTLVAENADFFRIRREVEDARTRWDMSGRRRDRLIPPGIALAEAETVGRRFTDELDADTRAYIGASAARARLNQRLTAGAAVVFFAAALAAGYFGWLSEQRARSEAAARQDAIAAQGEAERQAGLAEAAALDAAERRDEALAAAAAEEVARRDAQEQAARAEQSAAEASAAREAAVAAADAERTAREAADAALRDARSSLSRQLAASARVALNDARYLDAACQAYGSIVADRDAQDPGHQDRLDVVGTLYDALTRYDEIAASVVHDDLVNHIAAIPETDIVVSRGRDGTLVAWNHETGATVRAYGAEGDKISRFEVSPDFSTIVAGTTDGQLIRWETETGRELNRQHPLSDAIFTISHSSSGNAIAISSVRGNNLLIDPDDLSTIIRLDHDRMVDHFEFNEDESLLLIKDFVPGDTMVWDIQENRMVWQLNKAIDLSSAFGFTYAFFADDGTSVLASTASYLTVWPEGANEPVRSVELGDDVRSYTVFKDEDRILVAAGHENGDVSLGDFDGFTSFRSGDVAPTQLVFSQSGNYLATWTRSYPLSVWDTQTRRRLTQIGDVPADVTAIEFIEREAKPLRMVVGFANGQVRSYYVVPGTERTLISLTADLTNRSLGSQQDGSIVAFHSNNAVHIVDIVEKSLLGSTRYNLIGAMALSPDGQLLVLGFPEGTITGLGVPDLQDRFTIEGSQPVSSLAFSADGSRLVSTSIGGSAKVWAVESGALTEISAFEGHDHYAKRAVFSPDGRWVASLGIETQAVWDSETAELVSWLDAGDFRWMNDVAFSADGEGLVTAGQDGSVSFWDVATGTLQRRFTSHGRAATAIDFVDDGRLILVGYEDGTLNLLDADSGSIIARLVGHSDDVEDIAVNDSAERYITISNDGSARLWLMFDLPSLEDMLFEELEGVESVGVPPPCEDIIAGDRG